MNGSNFYEYIYINAHHFLVKTLQKYTNVKSFIEFFLLFNFSKKKGEIQYVMFFSSFQTL